MRKFTGSFIFTRGYIPDDYTQKKVKNTPFIFFGVCKKDARTSLLIGVLREDLTTEEIFSIDYEEPNFFKKDPFVKIIIEKGGFVASNKNELVKILSQIIDETSSNINVDEPAVIDKETIEILPPVLPYAICGGELVEKPEEIKVHYFDKQSTIKYLLKLIDSLIDIRAQERKTAKDFAKTQGDLLLVPLREKVNFLPNLKTGIFCIIEELENRRSLKFGIKKQGKFLNDKLGFEIIVTGGKINELGEKFNYVDEEVKKYVEKIVNALGKEVMLEYTEDGDKIGGFRIARADVNKKADVIRFIHKDSKDIQFGEMVYNYDGAVPLIHNFLIEHIRQLCQ